MADKKILIVEDEEDFAEMLQLSLNLMWLLTLIRVTRS